MVDQSLLAKYRALKRTHEGYGQRTPARTLIEAARRALVDDAMRARFADIGVVEYVDCGARWYDETFETRDTMDADVRVLLVPDDDIVEIALDFECCTTNYPNHRPRILDDSHSRYGWRKCDHVTSREPADVRTVEEHADVCHYGQPCKHKCDEAQRVERYGGYGVIGQYRDFSGRWQRTDAEVWGFVDDDWKGDADLDAMRAALDAYDADTLRESISGNED